MINEIIIDMFSFMLILTMITFSLGLVFFIAFKGQKSFFESLTHTYRLDYGDFDPDYSTPLQWFIFLLGTITGPLVLLNLLIAIMGDTYDRV
mmetsp:Transcript_27211/g.5021  ORF Transcript_27211/g.5021 Transcript_27211/m.5021 type:complete len:92 (-) Transcript_27211:1100-1375(-)